MPPRLDQLLEPRQGGRPLPPVVALAPSQLAQAVHRNAGLGAEPHGDLGAGGTGPLHELPRGENRNAVEPAALALLQDAVWPRGLDDHGLHPQARLLDPHPGGGPHPGRLEALEPVVAQEVIGERGTVREVAEEVIDLLARSIDRPGDRHRPHQAGALADSRWTPETTARDSIGPTRVSNLPICDGFGPNPGGHPRAIVRIATSTARADGMELCCWMKDSKFASQVKPQRDRSSAWDAGTRWCSSSTTTCHGV